MRVPPLSTLFPYTTLFRSLDVAFSRRMCCSRVASVRTNPRLPLRSVVWPTSRPGIWRTYCSRVAITPQYGPPRSEEHTSELQSHSDLVCRLLLEKKKKTHR